MPLDDALALVARSFDKYLQAEKEKAVALSSSAKLPSVPFLPPAKEIAYLLNLLADNRQLTVDELNKVIVYLKERRDKLMEAEGIPPQNGEVFWVLLFLFSSCFSCFFFFFLELEYMSVYRAVETLLCQFL